MTPEEIYKKQTGVPATYPFYVHSVGYVKWLEEQNAKLLEALKKLVARLEAGKDPKAVYERGLQKSLLSAKQAIAEGQS